MEDWDTIRQESDDRIVAFFNKLQQDRDNKIIDDTEYIIDVCSAVRSIREDLAIPGRMPIASVTIYRDNFPDSEELLQQLKEECNLKRVIRRPKKTTDKVKVNFKTVGPKFGSAVKEIKALVDSSSYKIEAGKLIVGSFILDETDFSVLFEVLPTERYIKSRDLVVGVDPSSSPELQAEFEAREFIHQVQQWRKVNLGKKHIKSKVRVIGQYPEEHSSMIMNAVLALSLTKGEFNVTLVE